MWLKAEKRRILFLMCLSAEPAPGTCLVRRRIESRVRGPISTTFDAAPAPSRLGQTWEGHLYRRKEAFIKVVTDPMDR